MTGAAADRRRAARRGGGHGRDRRCTASGSPAPPPTSWSRRARVGPRWNAAAISGEYLSAASFLGVAGLIAKYGADALWYPVGFTAGYLGLLLFVAAPLRRSGAYTVPDFAEFRLGSRAAAQGRHARRRRDLHASTWCRSTRAPGLTLKTLLGMPVWVGPLAVGAHRHRQRRRRRHAVDHVRAGLPVLAQAHRDRRSPRWRCWRCSSPTAAELGGPLPPDRRSSRPPSTIETDVVVQVAAPAGITVTGTLDGRPVDARRSGRRASTRWAPAAP